MSLFDEVNVELENLKRQKEDYIHEAGQRLAKVNDEIKELEKGIPALRKERDDILKSKDHLNKRFENEEAQAKVACNDLISQAKNTNKELEKQNAELEESIVTNDRILAKQTSDARKIMDKAKEMESIANNKLASADEKLKAAEENLAYTSKANKEAEAHKAIAEQKVIDLGAEKRQLVLDRSIVKDKVARTEATKNNLDDLMQINKDLQSKVEKDSKEVVKKIEEYKILKETLEAEVEANKKELKKQAVVNEERNNELNIGFELLETRKKQNARDLNEIKKIRAEITKSIKKEK